MLTKLKIKNFKRLDDIEVELGNTVVFIGPNNSGKTTALQALALWDIGLKKWNEKRKVSSAKERTGVSINRKDILAVPVPNASLFWRNLSVRKGSGKNQTQNIRIDISVEGVTGDKQWNCGLEFDYTNEESLVCRPLRKPGFENKAIKEVQFTTLPEEASKVQIAYLPPMSGLAAQEFRKERGEINVMIGEGLTAQVLRNLCHLIYQKGPEKEWKELVTNIKNLFGVTLSAPQYLAERSELRMTYIEHGRKNVELDLSSSGRGLQQTLLLLAHIYANPNTVLLLDEPDAHLEILRQRQIYQMLTQLALQRGSQIIAASHSEVILNEAADRDIVVAFIGTPHRIDDRGSQVRKALQSIGFDQFYLAEDKGWVLYLEGSTDLAILQAFAKTLGHEVSPHLEQPFVHYVGNQAGKVRDHFWGLKEAKKDLEGIALFDRDDERQMKDMGALGLQWRKYEIENYLCMEEVLLSYAKKGLGDDLFGYAESKRREQAMCESISEISVALKKLKKKDPWSADTKVTDDFLDPLFELYFEKLNLGNLLRKSGYFILATLVPKDKIDSEIIEKLNAILAIAKKVRPVSSKEF